MGTLGPMTPAPSGPDLSFQGFGADALGGEGGSVVTVTTLTDGGAGSLRAAIEGTESNKIIEFSVSGTITLSGNLACGGHHITIAGSTSPSGITIAGATFSLETVSASTAHHWVIENIRFVGGTADCDELAITEGAHDVMVHQCSFRDADDGCIDITVDSYNVTVQWCIISKEVPGGGAAGASLIKYGGQLISYHHNLWYLVYERGPLVAVDDTGSSVGDTLLVDIVNEIHYGWNTHGSAATNGGWMNVRNSYYESATAPSACVGVNVFGGSNAQVYTDGNYSGNAVNIDAIGNQGSLIGSPPSIASMTSVEVAVPQVLAYAGAQPLDTFDQDAVDDVTTNGNLP